MEKIKEKISAWWYVVTTLVGIWATTFLGISMTWTYKYAELPNPNNLYFLPVLITIWLIVVALWLQIADWRND